MASGSLESQIEEYWDWFAVALFVLITVDMITTVYAAWYAGPAAEANPLMRWALGRGMVTVTAVNLVATAIAVGGFYLLVSLIRSSGPPYDRYLCRGVEIWLGAILSAGLLIFANNLYVIFHGRSLLQAV